SRSRQHTYSISSGNPDTDGDGTKLLPSMQPRESLRLQITMILAALLNLTYKLPQPMMVILLAPELESLQLI
ncbi:hypothetical protein, partial [Crocosphaera watsonii]|uniref:hypothetical protein n=1 Tax=Crocosphaera watsonii TaxID=263511 RepID=UPI0018CDC36A